MLDCRVIPMFVLLSCCAWTVRADIVTVASTSVSQGSTFTVPVSIVGASDLYAFQFSLFYDPLQLQLLSIDEGAFLGSAGPTFFIPGSIDNGVGTAAFTGDTLLAVTPGAVGSGPLALFTFEFVGTGATGLTLSDAIFLDSNLAEIPVSLEQGEIASLPEPNYLPFLAIMILIFWVVRFHLDRKCSKVLNRLR